MKSVLLVIHWHNCKSLLMNTFWQHSCIAEPAHNSSIMPLAVVVEVDGDETSCTEFESISFEGDVATDSSLGVALSPAGTVCPSYCTSLNSRLWDFCSAVWSDSHSAGLASLSFGQSRYGWFLKHPLKPHKWRPFWHLPFLTGNLQFFNEYPKHKACPCVVTAVPWSRNACGRQLRPLPLASMGLPVAVNWTPSRVASATFTKSLRSALSICGCVTGEYPGGGAVCLTSMRRSTQESCNLNRKRFAWSSASPHLVRAYLNNKSLPKSASILFVMFLMRSAPSTTEICLSSLDFERTSCSFDVAADGSMYDIRFSSYIDTARSTKRWLGSTFPRIWMPGRQPVCTLWLSKPLYPLIFLALHTLFKFCSCHWIRFMKEPPLHAANSPTVGSLKRAFVIASTKGLSLVWPGTYDEQNANFEIVSKLEATKASWTPWKRTSPGNWAHCQWPPSRALNSNKKPDKVQVRNMSWVKSNNWDWHWANYHAWMNAERQWQLQLTPALNLKEMKANAAMVANQRVPPRATCYSKQPPLKRLHLRANMNMQMFNMSSLNARTNVLARDALHFTCERQSRLCTLDKQTSVHPAQHQSWT